MTDESPIPAEARQPRWLIWWNEHGFPGAIPDDCHYSPTGFAIWHDNACTCKSVPRSYVAPIRAHLLSTKESGNG